MYKLPTSTEISRKLPKSQLYAKFGFSAKQRDAFDADIARMDFVNLIAPQTLPSIAEGSEVKAIFVVEVSLKRRDFDTKSIILLAKSIPQRVIYALRYGDEVILAVYHSKLFMTDWQLLTPNSSLLILEGLNLDIVWENIVSSIGQFSVEAENSLSEQIKLDEERAKLERQIAALERQMNTTKQPRRRRELFLEIQKLKENL